MTRCHYILGGASKLATTSTGIDVTGAVSLVMHQAAPTWDTDTHLLVLQISGCGVRYDATTNIVRTVGCNTYCGNAY